MVAVGVWFDLQAMELTRTLSLLEDKMGFRGMHGFLGGVVDPYLRKRIAARFATEGDSASGKWAALAQATAEIRASQGYGAYHPINRRTGQLEAFLTKNQGNIDFAGEVAILTLPGSSPSGLMLQKLTQSETGGKGPRGGPARPTLRLDESDALFVRAELALFFDGGVG